VNRLRQLQGMTQETLAEKAEIDRRYVQRIEKGTANPGVEVLARLRKAFKCSWDELLGS
jgi:transcriptional regulator with XRE-family HTH domain